MIQISDVFMICKQESYRIVVFNDRIVNYLLKPKWIQYTFWYRW